ncbi:hypothetical protein M885DRAFT_611263 [Pelagophyceae sp. CCMP2097]|nr:hypothetical protein M885DRAFT_611263 [Pelagophyceae sp. CCMP2097]
MWASASVFESAEAAQSAFPEAAKISTVRLELAFEAPPVCDGEAGEVSAKRFLEGLESLAAADGGQSRVVKFKDASSDDWVDDLGSFAAFKARCADAWDDNVEIKLDVVVEPVAAPDAEEGQASPPRSGAIVVRATTPPGAPATTPPAERAPLSPRNSNANSIPQKQRPGGIGVSAQKGASKAPAPRASAASPRMSVASPRASVAPRAGRPSAASGFSARKDADPRGREAETPARGRAAETPDRKVTMAERGRSVVFRCRSVEGGRSGEAAVGESRHRSRSRGAHAAAEDAERSRPRASSAAGRKPPRTPSARRPSATASTALALVAPASATRGRGNAKGRGGLHSSTASSAKKRTSQQFATDDANTHTSFESTLGNCATAKAPRTTAHHVAIYVAPDVSARQQRGGGGASAAASARKMSEARIAKLEQELADKACELALAHDDIAELAENGGSAALRSKLDAKFTVEHLEAELRSASQRCLAGDEAAEADCDKWGKLLAAHPERIKRAAAVRKAWDEAQKPLNDAALDRTRRVVPPSVHTGASRAALAAAGLPDALAARVMAERALWLVRTPARRVAKTMLADLRKLDLQRLDLVELRALYAATPAQFEADADGAKQAWREDLRGKLVALVAKEGAGDLDAGKRRHAAYADLPSDADETLAPLFDAALAPDDEDTAAPPAAAADQRGNELELLMAARRAAQLEAPASGDAAPELRPPPKRLAASDPRALMLATIVGGGAPAAPPPAFMAELLKKRAAASADDGAQSASPPAVPAFLAELQRKKRTAASTDDGAQSASPPAVPAFMAELLKKRAAASTDDGAQSASPPAVPAFLAELQRKKRAAAPPDDGAQSGSPLRPAFMAELLRKRAAPSPPPPPVGGQGGPKPEFFAELVARRAARPPRPPADDGNAPAARAPFLAELAARLRDPVDPPP